MKLIVILTLFSLFQACADSHYLDRTKKDASILQGTPALAESSYAKSVVMITPDMDRAESGEHLFFGICTGTIIGPRTIMTAGHCVGSDPKRLKIILNPTPREEGLKIEDFYFVIDKVVHEKFQIKKSNSIDVLTPQLLEKSKDDIDLALLLVDRDFPVESTTIAQTYLQNINSTMNQIATVAGFGKTTALKDTTSIDHKQINAILKTAPLALQDTALQKKRIVLEQWKAGGVCKGDSGAPLFIEDKGHTKIFAIATDIFANAMLPAEEAAIYDGCAGYGVYLNIEKIKPWILKSMAALEAKTGH